MKYLEKLGIETEYLKPAFFETLKVFYVILVAFLTLFLLVFALVFQSVYALIGFLLLLFSGIFYLNYLDEKRFSH